MNAYRGPPMTLGNAAQARVRFIAWCKDCEYQVEPDVAAQAARYGNETIVLEWKKRLVCSRCGSKNIDMVASGERQDPRGLGLNRPQSFGGGHG